MTSRADSIIPMYLRILLVMEKLGVYIVCVYPKGIDFLYNNRMAQKIQPRRRLHLLILKQMLTLAASGFGLVAALAWNNVIQEFVTTKIKPYLPQGSGLISLSIYAAIVTIIAVAVTYQLTKIVDTLEE